MINVLLNNDLMHGVWKQTPLQCDSSSKRRRRHVSNTISFKK